MTYYDTNIYKHHGPIYTIERNPIHPKYFLTLGDWTGRIWCEDIKTPILLTQYFNSYITSGCWSPTRASVFYITNNTGYIDIYDYYQSQSSPIFNYKVSDVSLSSICMYPGTKGNGGKFMLVGDIDGIVNLVEVSNSLSVPKPNEKIAILNMFERESKREKSLLARIKDIQRRQNNLDSKNATDTQTQEGQNTQNNLIRQVEQEYLELTEKVDLST